MPWRRAYKGRGYQHTFAIPEDELIAGNYEIVGAGSVDLPDIGIELRTAPTKRGPTSFGQILVRRDLRSQTALPNQSLTPMTVSITPDEAGDCSADGVFNADDLGCARSIVARDAAIWSIGTLPGDLNLDGAVDFDDFLTVSAAFGQTEASYFEGNINVTGGVDFADFLLLSDSFGRGVDTFAVPEPVFPSTTWILIGILARRRGELRNQFLAV
jgi:hypothetical protein